MTDHITIHRDTLNRLLDAWDLTVLPTFRDGMMQERMEDLRAERHRSGERRLRRVPCTDGLCVKRYYGERRLMLKSSQNAGCMRRSPASHCCQVRHVVCTSSAAAVCDKPAASLPARTSVGVGFRDGEPPRERFGWLLINLNFGRLDGDAVELLSFSVGQRINFGLHSFTVKAVSITSGQRIDALDNGISVGGRDRGAAKVVSGEVGGDRGHFYLQPLSPEARLWRIHNLDNTRIARNVKNIFQRVANG